MTHSLDPEFLFTERAQSALAELAQSDLSDAAMLGRLTELRKRFAPDEAGALLAQARLRRKAVVKFPDAERLYFTDEALQQASSAAVAAYRAEAFRGYARVADLGCGIGGDTLALAAVVPEVVAVERDPWRARLAQANVAARGLADRVRVVCGDWTQMALEVEAAFVDPARRVAGPDGPGGPSSRVFRLADLEPPIGAVLALIERVPDVALKATPGVDHAEIPPQATVEFISEKGTLKEALLRFGALRGPARVATLLPGEHRLDSDAPQAEAAVREPGAVLYEPDAAVLRATLVRALAAQLGAAQLDEDIAYLTGDTLVPTPFARAWRVRRHGPFNLKQLNRWLREDGAGDVTVKKRGSAIDPDEFRKRLKTAPGGPAVTVFLTQVKGKPWMVVGEIVE